MLKIYTVLTKIEDIDSIDINIFSPYRRQKISLCRNPEMRISSTAASLALMRALAELNISEKDLEYAENEFGKPYFKDHTELYFSVSHTDGLAVAAISDTPVGIDCEPISRTVSPSVAKRFFSLSEIVAYQNSLISLWVAKEAYTKLLGRPFAEYAKSMEIPYFEKELSSGELLFQKIPVSGFEVCVAKKLL